MDEQEVVVVIDGLPRPASVVRHEGGQVLVRLRHGGGHVERWFPAADLLAVEPTRRLPLLKIIGLGLLAVVGLLLLLSGGGGSNTPLNSTTPSPTPAPTASASAGAR